MGWTRWILRGAWLAAVIAVCRTVSAAIGTEDPWIDRRFTWLALLLVLAVTATGDVLLGHLCARLDARAGPSKSPGPAPAESSSWPAATCLSWSSRTRSCIAAAWLAVRLLPASWLRELHPWAIFAAFLWVLSGEAWLQEWGTPALW